MDDPALLALLLGKTAVGHERGIEVDVTGEAFRTAGHLPSTELVTIVGNLVDNAMDALGTGPRLGWIELTFWTTGANAMIEVRDSGPGIPPEWLDRVFEPGFSTKSGASRERGLGLALVRHAVVRLGGTVSVANDGGAVFTVTLPLRVAKAVSGAPR
jgi:sensor histidine kinase regulating citrate/malate metabolism